MRQYKDFSKLGPWISFVCVEFKLYTVVTVAAVERSLTYSEQILRHRHESRSFDVWHHSAWTAEASTVCAFVDRHE